MQVKIKCVFVCVFGWMGVCVKESVCVCVWVCVYVNPNSYFQVLFPFLRDLVKVWSQNQKL